MQYPDKTPWLASRIVGQNITVTQPELRLRVIAYLQEYDGTVEELASNLGINQSDIEDVLTDLARDGYLVSETVYSLKGAA
jgi:Mn-dependent DtxR family transcriptional regulator